MSNVSTVNKILRMFGVAILLLGISMAGFFVQSLHVTHAATTAQGPVITCEGGLHSTDQAPCPSVKYQNVVVAISLDSNKLSFEQDTHNYILPTLKQSIVSTKVSYRSVEDIFSRSFEKRNSWVTQLPRAHLS